MAKLERDLTYTEAMLERERKALAELMKQHGDLIKTHSQQAKELQLGNIILNGSISDGGAADVSRRASGGVGSFERRIALLRKAPSSASKAQQLALSHATTPPPPIWWPRPLQATSPSS